MSLSGRAAADEVQHGQASPAVASGVFGNAHARAAAARAATAREQRAWVVDPLRAHVNIAFVDASEALRSYETALADVKLQHAHARKLEAKGERKAAEAEAARAKLAAMTARIAPQAERVHSKLSLLVRKQEGDFDKWVAKMSKSERRLAEEAQTCVRHGTVARARCAALTRLHPARWRVQGVPGVRGRGGCCAVGAASAAAGAGAGAGAGAAQLAGQGEEGEERQGQRQRKGKGERKRKGEGAQCAQSV
jgi:hypothetical protein